MDFPYWGISSSTKEALWAPKTKFPIILFKTVCDRISHTMSHSKKTPPSVSFLLTLGCAHLGIEGSKLDCCQTVFTVPSWQMLFSIDGTKRCDLCTRLSTPLCVSINVFCTISQCTCFFVFLFFIAKVCLQNKTHHFSLKVSASEPFGHSRWNVKLWRSYDRWLEYWKWNPKIALTEPLAALRESPVYLSVMPILLNFRRNISRSQGQMKKGLPFTTLREKYLTGNLETLSAAFCGFQQPILRELPERKGKFQTWLPKGSGAGGKM